MFQNYNYYPQQNQPTQQQQPIQSYQLPQYRPIQPQSGLKGRLVSSIEEARATSIDFDGSVFYFPDLANKKIYTKQINMDGTATLCMYELKETPINRSTEADQFITRAEFEQVLMELNSRILPKQEKIEPKSF